VLGLLLRLAYPIKYWYGLLILIGYGAFIELSQYFIPDRAAEMKDIFADILGSFIGLKLYKYIKKVI
jgi:VanZ family protein